MKYKNGSERTCAPKNAILVKNEKKNEKEKKYGFNEWTTHSSIQVAEECLKRNKAINRPFTTNTFLIIVFFFFFAKMEKGKLNIALCSYGWEDPLSFRHWANM